MHIVSSADNSCSWVVELFRTPVALSLQDAASFANSLSATLGLTYLANKGRQHLSCCKSDGSKSLADFGHAVSLWGALKSNGNFVYVEPIQSGILAIAVQDGVPAYDGVI